MVHPLKDRKFRGAGHRCRLPRANWYSISQRFLNTRIPFIHLLDRFPKINRTNFASLFPDKKGHKYMDIPSSTKFRSRCLRFSIPALRPPTGFDLAPD
jgi:hypothetical protein